MRHISKSLTLIILGCLVSLFPIKAYSQTDYVEAVDSVEMSDEDMDSLANVPIFLGEGRASCETDSVIQARYIIEQIPGKKFTLYDGLKDTFVVDNMDHLEYNYSFVASDSIVYSYFNFEKGIMRGLIGICTDNNEKVIMSEYNPKYVVDISECTTIDSVITEKYRWRNPIYKDSCLSHVGSSVLTLKEKYEHKNFYFQVLSTKEKIKRDFLYREWL